MVQAIPVCLIGHSALMFALAFMDCQFQREISYQQITAAVGPILMISTTDSHEI